MKGKKKIISLGDIAQKAGVSRMTVSYALRNHPSVSAKTCLRIQTLARELKYLPDAKMASWMAQVRGSKAREPVPIAWINMDVKKDAWHAAAYRSPFFEGAKTQCERSGYSLEEFWLKESGMTPAKLSRIFFHRNIKGVIVAPPRNVGVGHLNLNWKHFASASFEKAILAPKMHRVIPDYFHNMMTCQKMLRRLGVERIGFLIHDYEESRSYHAYSAAVHYYQAKIPASHRIPILQYRDLPEAVEMGLDRAIYEKFARWLKKHRPEVVVGQHSGLKSWVEYGGISVPREMGVIHLAMEDDCSDWAGIWQRKREIGMATADLVVSMLQGNHLGLPEFPRDTLVQGEWRNGNTLTK